MRLFLIILVAIGVVFLGAVGFIDSGEDAPASPGDYEPRPLFAFFGDLALLWPGATYVLPDPNPFSVGPSPRTFVIPRTNSTGTRLVKLALVSGSFARVKYDCSGVDCSKELCLTAPGGPAPGCSGKRRDTGAIPLDPAGGTIRVEALPLQRAQVESR